MRGASWLALSLALAVLPLAAEETSDAGAGLRHFNEIVFTGNEALSSKELLEAGGLTPPSRFSLFRKSVDYSELDVKAAMDAATLRYQRDGYFDASLVLVAGPAGGAEIRVTEGKPCRVTEVRVETLGAQDEVTALPEADTLRANLPLAAGDRFTVTAYESCAALMAGRLKNGGYPFAEVTPYAEVDLAAHGVSVVYRLSPGEKKVFGPVEVAGVPESEAIIVRRALKFREGQPYRQDLVDESVEALYALGVYDSVLVRPRRRGGEPGEAPMLVQLKPGRFHRIRLGVGYGTEDRLRGQAAWETLRVHDRVATLGFQTWASHLEARATTYYKRPYFLNGSNALFADATYGRLVEADYAYRSVLTRAGVEHTFSPSLALSVAATAEKIVSITPDDNLKPFVSKDARDLSTMLSLQATLTRKTTDALLDPTRGSILMASVEPTHVVSGGTDFTRVILEGRRYLSLTPNVVAALRLRLGGILSGGSFDSVPLTRRFYTGGPYSVRGYGYHIIGPLSKTGALLGGEGLAEGSAELRFPISAALGGAVFLDSGTATPKAFSLSGAKLWTGAGAGIRFKTPVGPAGVDLAFPLKRFPLDNSPYHLYVYVGYAF